MYKEYFADHPMAPLGLLAMAIFMISFTAVVLYAWRKPRPEVSALAALPLGDDAAIPGRTP